MDKNSFYVVLCYCFGTVGIISFSMWVRYQMRSARQFLMMKKDESDSA